MKIDSKELKKKIDSTVIRLKLSPGNSLMNFPEQERFAINEINNLHKRMNSSFGQEKVDVAMRYVEIWSYYWKLIKSYIDMHKDTKNPRFLNEYRSKGNELFNYIRVDIERFKKYFDESEIDLTAGFGLCLIDLYLIYIDVASYVWQQPSPEYRAIYREVLDGLEKLKKEAKR